ncbi:MAG: HemX protein [Planctomycetota bacterium]|jgi:HemX protein
MSTANNALQVLTPMMYMLAFMAYRVRLGHDRTRRWSRPILILLLALGFHLAHLVVRGMMIGQAPWTTYFDTYSALAFLMTLTYAAVEITCRDSSTGYDFLPAPIILVTYSTAFGPHIPKQNPMLDSDLFAMHTVPAIGGMAALIVGGFYGLLYLRLARAIKEKRFDDLFKRLPDMETLARMNYVALVVGFILVTAAIGWGATWYRDVFQQLNILEPKIAFTLIIWVVLFLPVIGRMLKRWSDRWTAYCSVVILGLVGMTILISMLPFLDFHGHS